MFNFLVHWNEMKGNPMFDEVCIVGIHEARAIQGR
jgi:hypothetical protein